MQFEAAIEEITRLFFIIREAEQVLVPRVGNHPELLGLAGRIEEPLRVGGQGLVIALAADDQDRAAQLGDMIDRLDIVDG
jgi:hypothetical protein